jgi:hypothetical protein
LRNVLKGVRQGGGLIFVVALGVFVISVESLDVRTGGVNRVERAGSLVIGVQLDGRFFAFKFLFMDGWLEHGGFSHGRLFELFAFWLEGFVGASCFIPGVVRANEGRWLINVVVALGFGAIEVKINTRSVIVIGLYIWGSLFVHVWRWLRKDSVALGGVVPGVVVVDVSGGLGNSDELFSGFIVVVELVRGSSSCDNFTYSGATVSVHFFA